MTTTKLSSKGQVVIPAEVREELGLEKGAEFRVELRDGEIVLVPQSSEDWRSYRGCLEGKDSATEALEEERRRDREREREAAGGI